MKEKCKTCKFWDRDGVQPGRMPGVSDRSRRCLRPRQDKSIIEYRRPKDWCDAWTLRNS